MIVRICWPWLSQLFVENYFVLRRFADRHWFALILFSRSRDKVEGIETLSYSFSSVSTFTLCKFILKLYSQSSVAMKDGCSKTLPPFLGCISGLKLIFSHFWLIGCTTDGIKFDFSFHHVHNVKVCGFDRLCYEDERWSAQ